jgi:hypothetical protein
LSTVHLTTPSTVLGQARRRTRENPRTYITSEILHAHGGPIADTETAWPTDYQITGCANWLSDL